MEGEARGTEKRTAAPGLGDVSPQDVAGGVCQGVSCVCELLTAHSDHQGFEEQVQECPGPRWMCVQGLSMPRDDSRSLALGRSSCQTLLLGAGGGSSPSSWPA